jgi:hypothetical protein
MASTFFVHVSVPKAKRVSEAFQLLDLPSSLVITDERV